jgi:hypothetical protein
MAILLAGCDDPGKQDMETTAPARRAEGVGQALAAFEPAPAQQAPAPREEQPRVAERSRHGQPRRAAGAQHVTRIDDLDSQEGDAILPPGVVRHVMQRHFRSLVPCAVAEKRRTRRLAEVTIDFGIRGSGQVGPVAVNGMASGPLLACIRDQLRQLRFPSFDGRLTRARFSMTVQ